MSTESKPELPELIAPVVEVVEFQKLKPAKKLIVGLKLRLRRPAASRLLLNEQV
jgi:hypothetical protein